MPLHKATIRKRLWIAANNIGIHLYEAWGQMRTRCNNPRNHAYKNYGGRGIAVCKRWDSFEAFATDMGLYPGKGWSLDRIDNNKGYSKANCRWATPALQMQNRRSNVLDWLTVREIRSMLPLKWGQQKQLAKAYHISEATLSLVVNNKIWVHPLQIGASNV